MAYNPIDVTAGKGDTTLGPIWWKPGALEEDIDFSFDPTSAESIAAGWVKLGEGHTDGIDSAQEADGTDKMVWGAKNLGTTYTNFKDTLTARLASATDNDALKAVFGVNSIEALSGSVSGIRLNVRNRQPETGSWLFMMKTDDGRRWWVVISNGQADINITRSMGDEDIVVMETVVNCLQSPGSDVTHYELIEKPESETEEDPEEVPEG